jgi:branched-chain amino acid transport system permease protein
LLLQLIVSGIIAGSLYALIAIGFVMIYKATDVVNFAQGEIVMLGAYVGLMLYYYLKLPYLAAFFATLLVLGLFGILMERIAYRPLIKQPVFSIIIATLGMSIVLQNGAQIIWGPDLYPFPSTQISIPIQIRSLLINPQGISVLAISVFFMLLLFLFFKFTKFGKAMKATAQNKTAAAMMGISVNRVFSITWAISSALGAVSGILLAPLVGVSPQMGWIGMKSFIAAIIGGFTSLPGAVVGGLVLGVIENLVGYYVSTAYKDVCAYMVLMIVLIVKPTGFFEREMRKKV